MVITSTTQKKKQWIFSVPPWHLLLGQGLKEPIQLLIEAMLSQELLGCVSNGEYRGKNGSELWTMSCSYQKNQGYYTKNGSTRGFFLVEKLDNLKVSPEKKSSTRCRTRCLPLSSAAFLRLPRHAQGALEKTKIGSGQKDSAPWWAANTMMTNVKFTCMHTVHI